MYAAALQAWLRASGVVIAVLLAAVIGSAVGTGLRAVAHVAEAVPEPGPAIRASVDVEAHAERTRPAWGQRKATPASSILWPTAPGIR